MPFSPELAIVMGDCFIEGLSFHVKGFLRVGKEVRQSPRAVLKAQIAEAQKRGYVFKSGVEAELSSFCVLERGGILHPVGGGWDLRCQGHAEQALLCLGFGERKEAAAHLR